MALLRWRGHMAVMEFFGVIRGGPAMRSYISLLDSLKSNRRIKAVVIDLDSPGGSAAASHYLHQAVAGLAQHKPVVCFIREVGASGGYLLAAGATRIVAFPSALVGSIGVLSLRPIVQELLRRWGIRISVAKSGRLKDMGAFWREPTEEELAKEQALADDFYQDFVHAIARARRLEEARVREYATGEVFTARQAKEIGLVDELGDLERALDLASELGKVPRRYSYVRPRRDWRFRILSRFAGSLAEEIGEEVESRLSQLLYRYLSWPRY